MKVFNTIALVSGLVAANNKKVPPRTPPQRLETLSRFYKEFIKSYVQPKRPERAANQIDAVDRLFNPLDEIYHAIKPDGSGLRRCSFFDPTIPNGGPRPSADDQGRKRRDVDEDPFDAYEQSLESGERSASVRLSDNPALALRQVTTSNGRFYRPGPFSLTSTLFLIIHYRFELDIKNGFTDIFLNAAAKRIMEFIPRESSSSLTTFLTPWQASVMLILPTQIGASTFIIQNYPIAVHKKAKKLSQKIKNLKDL